MNSRANNSRLGVAAIFFAGALSLLLASLLAGQQGRREIVSDDFTGPRPTPTPRHVAMKGSSGRIGEVRPVIPPRRYRFVESSSPNARPSAATNNIQQLGLTLWRLRPATAADYGERFMVQEAGHSSEWVPERIEIGTPLQAGDRLRLSIESPRAGYLYIVDRDVYANGQEGDALLIFPNRTVRVDNGAGPGKLIDLPAQEDLPNYLTLQRRRSAEGSEQTGKVLTLLVTDKPLPLDINDQPLTISKTDLAQWEKAWAGNNERYELEAGAGQAWTRKEREAATAPNSHLLRQGDPPPQTIYRLASTNKTAFLINVRLSY